MTFTVSDLERPLTGQVTDAGVAVDVTAATSVVAHIRRPDATVLSRAVTIVSAAAGTWSLPWIVDDLNQPGRYAVEVQVNWPGARPQTFGPVRFTVRPQLA